MFTAPLKNTSHYDIKHSSAFGDASLSIYTVRWNRTEDNQSSVEQSTNYGTLSLTESKCKVM